jgi:hypothetical protein
MMIKIYFTIFFIISILNKKTLSEFVAVDFKKTEDINTRCTILDNNLYGRLQSQDEVYVVHMFDKENMFFTYEILKFKNQIMKHFMNFFFPSFPCTVFKSSKYVKVNVDRLKQEMIEKFTLTSMGQSISLPKLSFIIDLVFDDTLNTKTDYIYVFFFYFSIILSFISVVYIYICLCPYYFFTLIINLFRYLIYLLFSLYFLIFPQRNLNINSPPQQNPPIPQQQQQFLPPQQNKQQNK